MHYLDLSGLNDGSDGVLHVISVHQFIWMQYLDTTVLQQYFKEKSEYVESHYH